MTINVHIYRRPDNPQLLQAEVTDRPEVNATATTMDRLLDYIIESWARHTGETISRDDMVVDGP